MATIRLRLADPAATRFGSEFEVELPQLDDADFLIPAHRYKAAASKGWRVEDRCAVPWVETGAAGIKVENWWNGVVDSQNVNAGQWQGSPWNALTVMYYNVTDSADKLTAHSFWELHDESVLRKIRDGSDAGGGCRDIDPETPALDPSTAKMLMERVKKARQNPEYDPFIDTIGSDVSFPQCDGTRVNYCSMVPLPMALDTVMRRLQLGYYRQTAGFQHDVATILSNCELFNGSESEYTASAAELEKELCKDLPLVDPTAPILGVEPAAAVPPAPAEATPSRRRR